jgi:HSP20 family protein
MALTQYEGKKDKDLPIFRPWGLERSIRQLFETFPDLPKEWEFPAGGGGWFPAVDISETPQEYRIRAEIPGMKKEDTKISVNNNVLTLSGEKKSEAKHEDKKYHRVESYYGAFRRSFVLPDAIKADKVSANFKDGILNVTIPKSEESKEKNVDIKVE